MKVTIGSETGLIMNLYAHNVGPLCGLNGRPHWLVLRNVRLLSPILTKSVKVISEALEPLCDY